MVPWNALSTWTSRNIRRLWPSAWDGNLAGLGRAKPTRRCRTRRPKRSPTPRARQIWGICPRGRAVCKKCVGQGAESWTPQPADILVIRFLRRKDQLRRRGDISGEPFGLVEAPLLRPSCSRAMEPAGALAAQGLVLGTTASAMPQRTALLTAPATCRWPNIFTSKQSVLRPTPSGDQGPQGPLQPFSQPRCSSVQQERTPIPNSG